MVTTASSSINENPVRLPLLTFFMLIYSVPRRLSRGNNSTRMWQGANGFPRIV
jgi:hypothetical protein